MHMCLLKAVNPFRGACGLSLGSGNKTSPNDKSCLRHICPNISSKTLDGIESYVFAIKFAPGNSSEAGSMTLAAMAGNSIIRRDELRVLSVENLWIP